MGHLLKLVFRNIFRHKLRSFLTMLGLVVAILAFGLLQTVVQAWYAGADMASATRLITRNATSLVFPVPIYYRERIRAIGGVKAVAVSNWWRKGRFGRRLARAQWPSTVEMRTWMTSNFPRTP